MSARVKLVAFAVMLAAIFGLGYGLGAAVGPFDSNPPSHEQHEAAAS